MLKTLHMHTSFVFSICTFEVEIKDEKRIMVASGGGDSFIYVWDIKQLQYDQDYVVKACYKPIRLNLQQLEQIQEGQEPTQFTSEQLQFNHYVPVYRQNTEMLVLCMVQCGEYLIAGYNSNEIVRWCLELKINKQGVIKEIKNEQFLLKHHNDSVNALGATKKLIASGGDDLCLMIQDVQGKLLIKYYCDEPVDAVKFSSSNQIVFGTNEHIFIIDLVQDFNQIKSIKKLQLEKIHQNMNQLYLLQDKCYFANQQGVYSFKLDQENQIIEKSSDYYYLFEQNQQMQQKQQQQCDFCISKLKIEQIYVPEDNPNDIKGLYFSKNEESFYILTNKYYRQYKQQKILLNQSLQQQIRQIQIREGQSQQQQQEKQQEQDLPIKYSDNYEQILQQIVVIDDKLCCIGGDLFRFIEIKQ